MKKILIIEDEKDLLLLLKDYLAMHQYEVYVAQNASEGLKLKETTVFDLIILDINLPDVNGINLCQQIRQGSMVPIIMLSARVSDADKVVALGFGADDYMTKPFSAGELVARVNAHLRRMEHISKLSNQTQEEIILGDLIINEKAYTLTINEKNIELSSKEFELLLYLAKRKNQVFTKEQLWDAIWGYDAFGDINTVTVYVRRLREKIEPVPSQPKYIKTVWGVGYKLTPGEVQ